MGLIAERAEADSSGRRRIADVARDEETRRQPTERAAALRSPLGRVANFLNRAVFAQTAIESEFMPETRAYDEMMRRATPWQKAVTSAIGGPAAHMWATQPTGEVLGRTFGAMGRGLRGEDAKFTSQIWADRYGLPETKRGRIGRGIAGFAVDVLRDPVTYADFGMLTKAGRVARMTGKKAPTVAAQAAAKQRAAVKFMGQPLIYGEKLFKPMTKAAAAVRPTTVGKKAVELFGRGSTHPALSRLLRLVGGRQQELSGTGVKQAWELREMGEQIARRAGRSVEETLPILGEAVEATTRETIEAFLERELPGAVAEGAEFVTKFRGVMGKELGEQLALGMKLGDLGEGYLKHLFTPEWNKAMKRLEGQMPYRAYTELHRSMKERILTRGYTIRQFNEMISGRGIREVLPELPEGVNVYIKKALHDDPAWLAAEYLRGSARARTGVELIAGIKQMDEVVDVAPLRAGPEAYEALGGELAGYKNIAGVKGLEGFAAPIELADEIQRVVGAIVDPATPTQFIRWFDTAQNWWKAWTLAPFPAYHTRNVAGNMWNSFLAGVKDPTVFHDAARIEMQLWEPTSKFGRHFKVGSQTALRRMEGGVRWRGARNLDQIARRYGFGSFDDLATAAHSRGVLGRGWMAAEVPHGGVMARSRLGRVLGRESEVVRGGMTVGTIMENNARLGLFLDQTRKNVDLLGRNTPDALKLAADDAAITVKKFLFDYTEAGVSQFEQRTLKRLMPFYTWTRNNVPLQLEYLLKKPRKFAAIEKAREAWQHVIGPGPTEKYMPEWKVQAYPWRLWQKGGIPEHLLMERWLPAADIAKAWGPRAIGETAMELASPFLKLPAELIANYSTYFRRPIEDYDWSQRKLLGMEMDPKLAYTLRQLRPVSELDWLLKGARGETTPAATVARALTGKVYPYDWKKERKYRRYELSEEISKLKRQLKRTPRETRRWRALKKKLDELRRARR